jgi:hypothetical protein
LYFSRCLIKFKVELCFVLFLAKAQSRKENNTSLCAFAPLREI